MALELVLLGFVALGFLALGLVPLGLCGAAGVVVELGPVLGVADPDELGLGSEVGVPDGFGALLARAVSH